MKKRVLILSASTPRSLQVAKKIQAALDYEFESTVWTQDIFRASRSVYDSFAQAVEAHDYGVFVLGPDDELIVGKETLAVARMNVVFELGYFAGKHGLERAFYLLPRGMKLNYLSDLAGMQPLDFDLARFERGEESAALGKAATEIADAIRRDRIQYPNDSHTRPNVLAGNVKELRPESSYALAAKLKAGHHVQVVVTGKFARGSDGTFGWGTPLTPTRVAWDHTIGISGGKQTYFASGRADAFTAFKVDACCSEVRLDIYESEFKPGVAPDTPVRTLVLPVVTSS